MSLEGIHKMLRHSCYKFLMYKEDAAAGTYTTNDLPVDVSTYYEATFFCSVTAASADDTLNITIMTVDPESGAGVQLATFTQITATGTFMKQINQNLGKSLYVVATVAGAAAVAYTFTIGVFLKS